MTIGSIRENGVYHGETAARLRVTHKLRTPDAIHVATAIVMQADFFLTNDSRLSVVQTPTILVLGNV